MKILIRILILVALGLLALFFPFYFAQELLPDGWEPNSPTEQWWSYPMAMCVMLSWVPFALVIAGLLKKWFNFLA